MRSPWNFGNSWGSSIPRDKTPGPTPPAPGQPFPGSPAATFQPPAPSFGGGGYYDPRQEIWNNIVSSDPRMAGPQNGEGFTVGQVQDMQNAVLGNGGGYEGYGGPFGMSGYGSSSPWDFSMPWGQQQGSPFDFRSWLQQMRSSHGRGFFGRQRR